MFLWPRCDGDGFTAKLKKVDIFYSRRLENPKRFFFSQARCICFRCFLRHVRLDLKPAVVRVLCFVVPPPDKLEYVMYNTDSVAVLHDPT